MQGWINLNDIAWWSKMSLEMHLCLKEWSHFGPFQAHQWRGIQKRFDGEQETYENDKKNRPYIILFGNLLSLSCSSRFLASKHGVFVPSGQIQSPERATFQTMNSVVSPCSYAVFEWRHKISVLVFWAFFCCIFIKRKMKLLKSFVHTYPNISETIFFLRFKSSAVHN